MIQKSIPILFDTKLPHSRVAKKLLRKILSSNIQPLHPSQIKEILKQRKTRKRVFLSQLKDKDLIEFFDKAPLSVQYAVFLEFNKKLKTTGGEAMNRHALVVYLFKDIYELHKTGLISNKFILNVLREMKEQNEPLPPIRRKDFVNIKRELGEGGEVYVLFPPDLHYWYKDIYENTKRGLWVKLHHKLLDKLAEISYNIHNQNLKEV